MGYSSPWMNDELRMFQSAVRKFLETEFLPHQEIWAERGYIDKSFWRKAGELGMLCPSIPEEYGGSGGDVRHDAVVAHEMARACVNFGFGVHIIAARYLLDYGTENQKRRWLPRMATGELIGCIGMSEPVAGSDLQGTKTKAERDGDTYTINGSKIFITNGNLTNLIMLVAKTDPSEGAKGVSLIYVETNGPSGEAEEVEGFSRGKPLKKIGQKEQDTCELFFSNMRVPSCHCLGGQEGQGFYQMMDALPYERLFIALGAVAIIERALELTCEYVKEREAFGKRIIDFQNTQFELAECKTEAHIARVFVDSCLERFYQGELDTVTASMAKYWCTDKQCEIIDRCLQLFGGYGYMLEYPIARMYADARVQRIYGGTNEIMKVLISRSL